MIVCEISAKGTILYDLPGVHCGDPRREVKGLVVRSSSSVYYRNTCMLRFEADDDFFTTKRFMVNFKRVNITSCSSVLNLYYSKTDILSSPDLSLNCHTPPNSLGVIVTPGKYLALAMEKSTTHGYNFEIYITAFKTSGSCEFMCSSSHKCIDRDLVCDGIDNCFDNSDEYNCQRVFMNTGVRVGMFLCVIVAFIACCLFAVICYRRRHMTRGHVVTLHQPPANQQQPFTGQPPPGYYTGGYPPARPAGP